MTNEVTVTFVAVGRRANTNFSYIGVEFVDGRATVTGHPRRIRRLERRMRFRRVYREDHPRAVKWLEANGGVDAKNTKTTKNKSRSEAVETAGNDDGHNSANNEIPDDGSAAGGESASGALQSEGVSEGNGDEAPVSGNTKLRDVIKNLDPNNDSHWTATGLPSMSAIEKGYGSTDITRRDVKEALPGWNREKASANSEE